MNQGDMIMVVHKSPTGKSLKTVGRFLDWGPEQTLIRIDLRPYAGTSTFFRTEVLYWRNVPKGTPIVINKPVR